MNSLKDTYILINGVEIPCMGFGTWQTPDGDAAYKSVTAAVEGGYRLIDTASVYGNEESVGAAIKGSGVPRHELFITSKLWNSDHGYEKTLAAFDKTMKKLKLDYLDMYLIHWPVVKGHKNDWPESNRDTWRAFEKLYGDKLIRAIGVSNFKAAHLQSLMETADVQPMVNQIEIHPGVLQEETVAFCRGRDIQVEAWGPLGTGKMLEVPELKKIAAGYGKSAAQLCLRWSLQKGYIPLPKSVTPWRIKENAMIFDFKISPEDMETIDSLRNIGGSGLDSDNIDF